MGRGVAGTGRKMSIPKNIPKIRRTHTADRDEFHLQGSPGMRHFKNDGRGHHGDRRTVYAGHLAHVDSSLSSDRESDISARGQDSSARASAMRAPQQGAGAWGGRCCG